MLNWKLVALIVMLFGSLAEAQVVKVEVRWTQRQCTPQGCRLVTLPNVGSGAVVGKLPTGESLVLTCGHIHTGPAGSQFAGIVVDGKTAHLQRRSKEDDISILWVEGDLGKALPIATADAAAGDPLVLNAFDGQSGQRVARRGHVVRANVLSVGSEPGNSGGPLLGRRAAIYGVSWGTSPTSSGGTETHFTAASRVVALCNDPRPIGGIMFYNPLEVLGYALSPKCPVVCPPPIDVPPETPQVPPETFRRVPQPVDAPRAPSRTDPFAGSVSAAQNPDIAIRLQELSSRIHLLDQRLLMLEIKSSSQPAVPSIPAEERAIPKE